MQVNNEFTKLSASNLNFFYGSKQVLKKYFSLFQQKRNHRLNRTVRLREKYFSAHLESNE